MKKGLIILFVVFLTGAAQLFSQDNRFSLGMRGGVTLSKLQVEGVLGDFGVGYRFGVVSEYKLSQKFFMQSGVDFLSRSTKSTSAKSYGYSSIAIMQVTCNQVYLELPILAGYNLNCTDDFKLRFMAGPYLAYGIGGDTKNAEKGYGSYGNTATSFRQNKESTFSEDGLKRFDMGLHAATGTEYKNFQVTIGFEYGLTNISQITDHSVHNLTAFATIGCRFSK